MRKKLMSLLPVLLISSVCLGCDDLFSIRQTCIPNLEQQCGPKISMDMADPDMATPDMATPDLGTPADMATPDLATPDLATPDLATPDMASPDMATPDMATAGDLTSGVSVDGASCRGNGLKNFWGFNQQPCGADCGPTCKEGEGCNNQQDCASYMSGIQTLQYRCIPDIVMGTPTVLTYCIK